MSARSNALFPRAWLIVGLLWFVGCFNYLPRIMVTTMHGSIMHAFPITDAQFGLLTSSFLWVYGLLSPFAGFLSDRFSRSRVIIVSMFVWSLVTWLTAYAKNFEELIAMRALMGAAEACYLPAALALITDYHRGPTRSLATGINMTGIMFGSALGGLGGWLAETHTWRYPFVLIGLMGIAYSGLLVLLLRDAPRESSIETVGESVPPKARFGAAVMNLFSNGSFILILVFWGLLGIVGWVMAGWMPTYVMQHFHMEQGAAGMSVTSVNLASLVGVLLGGVWADRWSRSNERGRIYVAAIGLCIAAPGILLIAKTSVFALAIAGLVLYSLTRVFSDCNMMPILCMVSDPRYRATGYGVLNAFACIVGGTAIYATGWLRDSKIAFSGIFIVSALCCVGCAALLLLARQRPARLVAGPGGPG